MIGQTITITSSCTNSPTSYTWTGCASTGTTCTDSVGVAGSKTYSLIASNGSGAGNTASVAVNWTAPPTSPPTCSITASSPSPIVGQSITLSASCSGSPTSYVWTNCTSTSSTCVTSAAAAGAATYSVAGVNAFGKGERFAGVIVNWRSQVAVAVAAVAVARACAASTPALSNNRGAGATVRGYLRRR